jgi:outer membrane lipoprotein-sorting protein
MQRIFALVALALFSCLLASTGAAALTEDQKADLGRISTYLSGVHTLTARFTQVGSDGKSDQGTFSLKRPGGLRLEYDKPSPILVVSDGSTIAITNSEKHNTDRYPLLDSPLRVLLSNDVNLAADPRIADVKRSAGSLSLVVRQTTGAAQGEITLTFNDTGSALELKQWELVDSHGKRTAITITDIKTGMDLPASLFVIKDLSPFSHGDN